MSSLIAQLTVDLIQGGDCDDANGSDNENNNPPSPPPLSPSPPPPTGGRRSRCYVGAVVRPFGPPLLFLSRLCPFIINNTDK